MESAPFTLIIVMGLPASGKTTLSKKLAAAVDLPLVSRDEVKMIIMDNLGWKDREWSRKVGKTSYEIIDYMVGEHLKSRRSFIVETDFRGEFAEKKFQQLQAEYGFNCVQIICTAHGETLIRRWQERAASDSHHPSMVENEEGLKDLREAIAAGERQPMNLRGAAIRVDTDDVTKIDNAAIVERVQRLLAGDDNHA